VRGAEGGHHTRTHAHASVSSKGTPPTSGLPPSRYSARAWMLLGETAKLLDAGMWDIPTCASQRKHACTLIHVYTPTLSPTSPTYATPSLFPAPHPKPPPPQSTHTHQSSPPPSPPPRTHTHTYTHPTSTPRLSLCLHWHVAVSFSAVSSGFPLPVTTSNPPVHTSYTHPLPLSLSLCLVSSGMSLVCLRLRRA